MSSPLGPPARQNTPLDMPGLQPADRFGGGKARSSSPQATQRSPWSALGPRPLSHTGRTGCAHSRLGFRQRSGGRGRGRGRETKRPPRRLEHRGGQGRASLVFLVGLAVGRDPPEEDREERERGPGHDPGEQPKDQSPPEHYLPRSCWMISGGAGGIGGSGFTRSSRGKGRSRRYPSAAGHQRTTSRSESER